MEGWVEMVIIARQNCRNETFQTTIQSESRPTPTFESLAQPASLQSYSRKWLVETQSGASFPTQKSFW